MIVRVITSALFALYSVTAIAEQPTMGPVIEDYGPAFLVDDKDIPLVVHADATKSLLKHDAYQSRFDSENSNLDLVHKLADAGVDIYVCGQSLGFRQLQKRELASPVKVGLSAMTLIANLQSQGYTFQP